MTNHEITTFLGTLQDQVAGESLAKLSAISTSISLPKGTTLMEEGSAHDYFYILVKGSAKAYHWMTERPSAIGLHLRMMSLPR